MTSEFNWLATSLRMTVFAIGENEFDSEMWWTSVVGHDPDEKHEDNNNQKVTYQGSFEQGRLALEIYGIDNRVNWLYSPNEAQFVLAGKMPVLGPFLQTADRFAEYMHKWLSQQIPQINRIAFGAIVVRPADSRAESYRMLSEYLGIDFDVSSTSDLMYRINRRRLSDAVKGVTINRVATWSSQDFNVELANQFGHFIKRFSHCNCLLEVDINNVPSETQLDHSHLFRLFNEFIVLGKEISEKGDV